MSWRNRRRSAICFISYRRICRIIKKGHTCTVFHLPSLVVRSEGKDSSVFTAVYPASKTETGMKYVIVGTMFYCCIWNKIHIPHWRYVLAAFTFQASSHTTLPTLPQPLILSPSMLLRTPACDGPLPGWLLLTLQASFHCHHLKRVPIMVPIYT